MLKESTVDSTIERSFHSSVRRSEVEAQREPHKTCAVWEFKGSNEKHTKKTEIYIRSSTQPLASLSSVYNQRQHDITSNMYDAPKRRYNSRFSLTLPLNNIRPMTTMAHLYKRTDCIEKLNSTLVSRSKALCISRKIYLSCMRKKIPTSHSRCFFFSIFSFTWHSSRRESDRALCAVGSALKRRPVCVYFHAF